MNRYASIKLIISDHAYDQYCARVGKVDKCEIQEYFNIQLNNGNYDYDKKGFICLDGVWWVYSMQPDGMVLITCYGKTSIDIPKALKWSRVKRDRLDFSNMVLAVVDT